MAYQFMPMYNVDFPVGIGEPNDSRDVMLVTLLFIAYDQATQFHRTVGNLTTHTGLQPDGEFHPRLADWITAFQSTSGRLPPDGKIQPIPSSGGTFVGMTGGVSSTLAVLNYNVLRAAPVAHRLIAQRMHLQIKTGF